MYQIEHSAYPTSLNGINCPTGPTDDQYCLKPSLNTSYSYKYYSPDSFMLVASNGNTCYSVTNNSAPVENCITIGTQTWMKYNLDVGTMIPGATAQTNNSIVEKYCYSDDPNNCNTYGGLYIWDEAMQYSTIAGVQGIAPAGFHIPTDTEYKTLEIYLGLSEIEAEATDYRGTTQGDQLRMSGLCQGRTPCGTTGFDGIYGGKRDSGVWGYKDSWGDYWTSSQIVAGYAWYRSFVLNSAQTYRGVGSEPVAFSIRVIKD